MSSHNKDVIILFLVSSIINYYIPVPSIGFNLSKRYSFLNRLYLAIFSAFIITLTDLVLHRDDFSKNAFLIWIMILTMGAVIFYYFIANQLFVDDMEYINTMKENHEIDLNISTHFINHPNITNDGKDLAKKIIDNRNDELHKIENVITQKKINK